MGVFSLLTPLGAALGMLVRASSDGSSAGAGVCTALGAGTFLHVAAMEVRYDVRLPLAALFLLLLVVCSKRRGTGTRGGTPLEMGRNPLFLHVTAIEV